MDKLGYRKLVAFDSVGADLFPVYHTNVMMTIGTGVAIVCAESIRDDAQRRLVLVRCRRCPRACLAALCISRVCLCGYCTDLGCMRRHVSLAKPKRGALRL